MAHLSQPPPNIRWIWKSLQKPRNNVAGINCPEMAEITRLLRTLGELDLSEGRAYNLSFVTSPGEYNIADDT